jgi:transcriptional regulator with GAF, ATPase, and Fis domain
VLITGETGTGKELVARAIHERSERRTRPLLTVNCGAIPEALFESELFGHVKGAFSGAVRDKIGYFELADGGTLFLDEIGDVPLPVQVKLLRVLQEQELARVGDTRARKINFRIIAATNRDIVSDVDAGRFRQDLYYRLSVFPIAVPPLRERREDILLLAAHFVGMYAAKINIHPPQLSKGNIERLLDYHWPGNVRELQNVIERFVIVSQTGEVQLHLNRIERQVPRRRLEDRAPLEGLGIPIVTKSELRERERESIVAALARTNGMVAGPRGAALLLGMKPTTLFSRIKALGIVYDASNPWRQGRQGKTVSASRSQESDPTGGLAGKNGDGKAAAPIRHPKSLEQGSGEGTHPSDEVTDPQHSKRKAPEGDV